MKLITVYDIYNVVKKTYKHKSFTLRDAIDKTANAKKLKMEDLVDQYGSLYTELSQDPRFKLVEDKNWRLTEFLKVGVQEKITENLYDEKRNEVYEEGFAPVFSNQEEDNEIALDEEYEFFDEDDNPNLEEKQKQLTEGSDDFEEIEIDEELKEEKK